MKKLSFLTIVLLGCSVYARAQENGYPKAEVFGGFSVLSSGNGDREQAYGWQASVNGNLHTAAGFVADVGGQYRDFEGIKLKAHQFLFGPRFTARGEKATGFVHALFGATNARANGFSQTGFTMGFGGGADVNVGKRLAIRIFQFDWLPSRFEGEWSKSEIRFGFGIVIKSGS